LFGEERRSIPLTLALEWASVHGDAIRRAERDGGATLDILVDSVVVEDESE
jgi:hypothetical protein